MTELTTSERPATYIGYKSDGRVKVYRYVVVLEENSGVGVNFGQVETSRRNVPSLSETPMINATSAVGHTALLIVDDRAEGSYAARPSRTNASPACHSWSVPVGATTTGGTAPVSSDV